MTSALVLGGGGVAGVAWEIGILAGLAEAGVCLRDADLLLATSAGALVAAQLVADADLDELYARQLVPVATDQPPRMGIGLLLRYALALFLSRDPQRFGARVGALACSARTISEAERKQYIAAQLPAHEWPNRRLVITAVDALSGEFVQFDRESGVTLLDAVAASCASPGVWPPITINGRQYIDGGIRSPANVDLADGADRIVVIAPEPRGAGPMRAVSAQVARLGDSARVAVVSPDAAARDAFGPNVLDPARRAPAARAGREQAAVAAPAVFSVWSD
jgi:NTE family protein